MDKAKEKEKEEGEGGEGEKDSHFFIIHSLAFPIICSLFRRISSFKSALDLWRFLMTAVHFSLCCQTPLCIG